MDVAVVGAGPAGLTAASRLKERGADVVVFESREYPGGRTYTRRYENGHELDTGAGWIGSFYGRYLRLLDELGIRDRLVPINLAADAKLSQGGHLVAIPQKVVSALTFPLLSWRERLRLAIYAAGLFWDQPRAQLDPPLAYDRVDAATHLRERVGPAAVDVVFRPAFSAVFADLADLSAALIRPWLRAGLTGRFFVLDGGMDTPWRMLAERCEVRLGTSVDSLSLRDDGRIDVGLRNAGAETFDAVVAAGPLPSMVDIIDSALSSRLPHWLPDIRYAPHMRVYATVAREVDRADIHPLELDRVVTVGRGGGRLWGFCPPGRGAAIVGTCGHWGAELLLADDETAADVLWSRAQEVDCELFDLEDADRVDVIRWRHAVPECEPGYFHRLATFRQEPPLLFAGDWLEQPCMEGAVRSGENAAGLLSG